MDQVPPSNFPYSSRSPLSRYKIHLAFGALLLIALPLTLLASRLRTNLEPQAFTSSASVNSLIQPAKTITWRSDLASVTFNDFVIMVNNKIYHPSNRTAFTVSPTTIKSSSLKSFSVTWSENNTKPKLIIEIFTGVPLNVTYFTFYPNSNNTNSYLTYITNGQIGDPIAVSVDNKSLSISNLTLNTINNCSSNFEQLRTKSLLSFINFNLNLYPGGITPTPSIPPTITPIPMVTLTTCDPNVANSCPIKYYCSTTFRPPTYPNSAPQTSGYCVPFDAITPTPSITTGSTTPTVGRPPGYLGPPATAP